MWEAKVLKGEAARGLQVEDWKCLQAPTGSSWHDSSSEDESGEDEVEGGGDKQ